MWQMLVEFLAAQKRAEGQAAGLRATRATQVRESHRYPAKGILLIIGGGPRAPRR